VTTDWVTATRCWDACSAGGRLNSQTKIPFALTPFFVVACTESPCLKVFDVFGLPSAVGQFKLCSRAVQEIR
jgi:hypothetical protein